MNDTPFDMNEFIRKEEPEQPQTENQVAEEVAAPELDVQKAVVESLAEDKAKLDESLAKKDAEIKALKSEIEVLNAKQASLTAELEAQKAASGTIESLNARIVELQNALAAEQIKQIDTQERNPNALALLDRDVELPDRFPGETRDQVLEVIKEARDKAESDGRIRRAQILESVLVANEPNGSLAKERADLEKIFAENGNILSGIVLEELSKRGIPHKNGEEYLLPAEIIKRTY